jgi:uncharacterized protein (TIGR02996 family)
MKTNIRHRGDYYVARVGRKDHRLCMAVHGIEIARQVLDRIVATIPAPPTEREEIAFHAALEERPSDRVTLLAYADWLNEQDRAEEARFYAERAGRDALVCCVQVRDRRPATTLTWQVDCGPLCEAVDVSVLRGLRFPPWDYAWVYPSRAAADHDLLRAWLAGRRVGHLGRRNRRWFSTHPIEFAYGW